MPRPALEPAGIFRQHGDSYRQAHRLPRDQLRVMRAIEVCRTAVLGGHVESCSQCDFTRIAYNSCRNRHCPKCQNTERARWLERRRAELLPVEYFHVVFTVPDQIARIAFYNRASVYDILFRAASGALLTIARDPKHLGAEIGFFAILHTWGQNLLHHPHVHCVIPGGGLSPDGRRWICCRPGFFLPVRVLSRLFRRLFVEGLQAAFDAGQLQFFGDAAGWKDRPAFLASLAEARRQEWVVYAKPPFGGPAGALEYLGRYTHRVAISNQRLIAMDDGSVTFQWKDYRSRHGEKSRTMTLRADEFIRRFLIHTLPPGFQRIRHFGFLANCHRRRKLEAAREFLTGPSVGLLPEAGQLRALAPLQAAVSTGCPHCGAGLIRVAVLPGCRWPAKICDTS